MHLRAVLDTCHEKRDCLLKSIPFDERGLRSVLDDRSWLGTFIAFPGIASEAQVMSPSAITWKSWLRQVRVAAVVLGLIVCPPTAADWLVTLEGKLIETRGPWTIDGRTLAYTDLEGVEQQLDLDEVDLEGSEETTALKAGKPYVPRQETDAETSPAPRTAAGKPGKRSGKKEKPKIILYTAALCTPCTEARELLEELGVDFRECDITKSKRAQKEYKKKAGHGGGLPVIDLDGTMIYTWNPGVVRRKVREYLKREAEAESSRP